MTKKPNLNEVALIYENRSEIAAIKTDIKYIAEDIKMIKNNHLAHIESDISEIKKSISALQITDSQLKPISKLFFDILKFVIFAVLGAGLALVIR